MEKIKYRFLNYKKYSTFLRDRREGGIPDDSDAIVFIKEGHRIWARGEEYVCSGSSGSNIDNKTLSLIDGYGNTVFTISLNDGNIILADSQGNILSDSYIRREDFDTLVRSAIRTKQDKLIPGRNISISDNNTINCDIIIDDLMSDLSTNPVQNRVIMTYLGSYVTQQALLNELLLKQDTLISGNGIDITGNIISCTLDTNVYVIVKSLSSVADPNPNKIYILESTENDETTYTQYRYEGGLWVAISSVAPTIDLNEVYTYIDGIYQRKGNYLTEEAYDSSLLTTLTRYALISYVDDSFVNKNDVYSGEYENYVSNGINEGVYISGGGNSGSGSGNSGGSTGTIISNIVLDDQLSYTSSNAVKNKVITRALQEYVKTTELNTRLTGVSPMVTLSTQQYLIFAQSGMIEPNVYYFTYEEEELWQFGGTFPITFSGSWAFGLTFPITLS